MAEREKVIRGLECCITGDPDGIRECKKCPYRRKGITNEPCFNALHADTLALFREQEPRVMTLDEICSSGRPFAVYAENWDGELFQVANIGGKYLDINGKQCPERVRLWTSRPTDEQRKAVLWNG